MDNKKLFPYIGDKSEKLLIDEDSKMYITRYNDANIITNIIGNHLDETFKVDPHNCNIVDMTAGVGGNVLSFSTSFNIVYGIEIDEVREKYLKNNAEVYGFDNIVTYCGDSMNCINNINGIDVIFIDPPWGGKNYKDVDSIQLSLSNTSIEKIINDLFNSKNPKIICLKLPNNYDMYHLYCELKKYKIYLYALRKMTILIIENTLSS